jgi:hypothetical protein
MGLRVGLGIFGEEENLIALAGIGTSDRSTRSLVAILTSLCQLYKYNFPVSCRGPNSIEMCHEIYTVYLPMDTVATWEYRGRVFGCDFGPLFHFLRAWGLCSSGMLRRVTVLLVPDVWRQPLDMKLPRYLETADSKNTVVRRHTQKKGDLKLTASLPMYKNSRTTIS